MLTHDNNWKSKKIINNIVEHTFFASLGRFSINADYGTSPLCCLSKLILSCVSGDFVMHFKNPKGDDNCGDIFFPVMKQSVWLRSYVSFECWGHFEQLTERKALRSVLDQLVFLICREIVLELLLVSFSLLPFNLSMQPTWSVWNEKPDSYFVLL